MIELIKTIVLAGFALLKFIVSAKLLKYFPPASATRPTVTVRQGKLRGATARTPNGSSYHFFKGIPYAKPPIGELRFRSPVPIDRFYKPVVDCLVDRSMCIQRFVKGRVIGKENGLYLNIFTPILPYGEQSHPKLPVMVWIHGGGFLSGAGDSFVQDPVYLVEEQVVVVTMNYRLGPLGFLCLPAAGIAGNAGLKDQLLVLKWVNENIRSFGGDPDNVTLFGESAGSMSAYLHYLSPNSRKYFSRVICQSGVACSDSFFQNEPENNARKLAAHLGYAGNDDKKILETLVKAPARLLVKHQLAVLNEQDNHLALRMPFRPVIEDSLSNDSIITELPKNILKRFDTFQMPLINGCTDGEGLLGLAMIRNRLKQFDQTTDSVVPQLLGSHPEMDKELLGQQIRKFYFGEKPIDKNSHQEIVDLMTDNIFLTNTLVNAEWMAKYQPKVKHYHYRFSYVGKLNFCRKLQYYAGASGACHADDIFYLFKSKMLPNVPDDSDESRVRKFMVQLWTNFAKYGEPTPDHSSRSLMFKWTPVQQHSQESVEFNIDCLEINEHPRMIRNPCNERKEFWRSLLKQYRKDLI